MKFTDPVTRLFFFIESVKAQAHARGTLHLLPDLLEAAGNCDPEKLSDNSSRLRLQSDELYSHMQNAAPKPDFLPVD